MPYSIYVQPVDATGAQAPMQQLTLHNDITGPTVNGQIITKDAFQNFVTKYIKNIPATSRATEVVAVRFNRHLLELMLAMPNCESLVFAKSTRPSGDQTISVVAVDSNTKPLGWDVAGGTFDPTQFISVEWGGIITAAQAQGLIIPTVAGGSAVDFDAFFNLL